MDLYGSSELAEILSYAFIVSLAAHTLIQVVVCTSGTSQLIQDVRAGQSI